MLCFGNLKMRFESDKTFTHKACFILYNLFIYQKKEGGSQFISQNHHNERKLLFLL